MNKGTNSKSRWNLSRVRRHDRVDPKNELIGIMQDRLIDPIATEKQRLLKLQGEDRRNHKKFGSLDAKGVADELHTMINIKCKKNRPPKNHRNLPSIQLSLD